MMKRLVSHLMKSTARVGASAALNAFASGKVQMKTNHKVECYGADGKLKWVEEIHNLVVDVGLNDLLSKYFKGASYTAAFFVGLKLTGTVAAGDTMASHAGWAESSAYSQANRPALVLGTVAAKSVDNSASVAVFSINGTATITGAFVTTDNAKGGTAGILYGASDFSASRAVVPGDTLNVTVTLSAS